MLVDFIVDRQLVNLFIDSKCSLIIVNRLSSFHS